MIFFYGYEKCDTCRKAKRWLSDKGIDFNFIDITASPPDARVLRQALAAGYPLASLFNRSGELYREMNIKDRFLKLSQEEALKLLSGHGKLIKRPIVTDGRRVTVGFDEKAFAVWTR